MPGFLIIMTGVAVVFLVWLLCLRSIWNPFRAMRRRLLRVFLLEHIAALVRLRLPLTSGVGACASRLSYASEIDLNNIEADLKSGLLLGDALGRVHVQSCGPVVRSLGIPVDMAECLVRPSEAEVLRIAEMTGNLGHGVKIVLDARRRASELRTWLFGTVAYVAAVALIVLCVLAGIMTFIVPKFKAMFNELDVELPGMTQMMVYASDTVADHPYLLLLPFLLAIPVFYWPAGWWRSLTRAKSYSTQFLQRAVYAVPFVHGAMRRALLAEFSRELAMLLRVGTPAHRALGVMAEGTMNPWFRDRIAEAAALCGQGVSLGEALDRARLDRRVGWFGYAFASGEDVVEALDALGREYEERVAWPLIIMARLIPPLLVIVLGLIVGYVVISLFLPLVALTNSMG